MAVIDDFAHVSVLCVGDLMLDRFVSGAVRRISPESPIPVLSVQDTKTVPGGAANVARNIASLGGRCTLIGVAGVDAAGDELQRALAEVAGVKAQIVWSTERPTTEKVRFVAQGQQLLRTDQERASPVSASLAGELLTLIEAHVSDHDVLVLSDYAKGVLTDDVVAGAIALARAQNVPVVVDPKSANLRRYAGATVVTPNVREVEMATGLDASEDDAVAIAAGQRIVDDAGVHAVLVTRAHRGMTLVEDGRPAAHWPASAREVFDVVGAGDTVVATLALALGANEALAGAARLANVAAGIVVGKRGTATVSPSELVAELTRLGHGHLASLRDKIMTPAQAVQRVALWKRDGLNVGFTNGCFDILHLGHLQLLNFARDHCDRLVVGLNSDDSTRRLKGEGRPINPEQDRAMVLSALEAVDAVVVFDEETPLDLIRLLAPQLLVKGADHAPEEIVGAELVQMLGGRVLRCELVPGRSTSRLIETLT